MKYDIVTALQDLIMAESKMPSVIITSGLAIEAVSKLRAENDRLMALAKLGRWVLQMRNESDCADLGGDDIQEKAVELGLLEKYLATEPCRDQCYCIAWSLFPGACVRLTDKANVPLTP